MAQNRKAESKEARQHLADLTVDDSGRGPPNAPCSLATLDEERMMNAIQPVTPVPQAHVIMGDTSGEIRKRT